MKRTIPNPILILALVAGALAPTTLAGELQVFLGNPTQNGRIRRFAEGTGAPLPVQSELRGLRLLPLDYNARLEADVATPGRPHLREDIEGAGRIELSGDNGVLYRFTRTIPGIPQRFGFLRIDAGGVTHLIAERPGTGQLGTQDPYGSRIALAPDGVSMLLATTLAAGGDLLEVHLISGLIVDRSASQAALDLLPHSLRLESTWAVAIASDGVYRTGRGGTDQVAAVPLDAATVFYSGSVVMSADGSQALTTAGVSAAAQHVWVFDQQGTARRASRDARTMSGAGYMPDAPHGPFFAVDNNGDLCAWRVEQLTSREVFMRRASSPPGLAAAQVTSSANFTDTLDEAGILTMFQLGTLVLAIGEQSLDIGVGIEQVDFFEVSLDAAGAPTILNITGTSGESSVPYLALPQLSPLFRRWLPAAQRFLIYDEQSGGTGRLAAFDPNLSGLQTIMADVKEVFFSELLGNDVIISLRMSTGTKPHRLVRLPADLSGPPVVILDTGDSELLQPIVDSSGWIAFREVPEFGFEHMHRYHVLSSTLQSFPLAALSYGPVLAWTGTGELNFSLERAGMTFFASWPTAGGGPYRLQVLAAQGAFLPGR